jgi:hypothetical protein
MEEGEEDEDGRFFGGGLNSEQQVWLSSTLDDSSEIR